MKNKLIYSLLALLTLSSCTAADFRKQVGIHKQAPDEFMVQPRAKLKIPEQAVPLAKPQKKVDGAVLASTSGREVIYGTQPKDNRPNTALEDTLLEKTGATQVEGDIRRTVEKDYRSKTGVFGTKRGSTLESILDPFGYNKPVDPVVDAAQENKRIKEAMKKGEKIDPKKVKDLNPVKAKWED